MDKTDKQLLELLQKDARMTNKQIASLLNLSITPVYERVKRLERAGYINRYVALVNPEKVDKSLIAYASISLKEHSLVYLRRFEEQIKQLREVVECYHIAGQFDYLLKIIVRDMKEYQSIVTNKLAAMENIGNVQSSFVMTEVVHSTMIPID